MSEEIRGTTRETRHDRAWQQRLLPVMVGLVVGLTLFFFAATMYQLFDLNNSVSATPTIVEADLLGKEPDGAEFVERQWRSLLVLESHVLGQRYHQANVLLMSRIWVRYLGFVTGMMLALIGAVFILGKLREPPTTLNLDAVSGAGAPELPGQTVKAQLATQSPGIVLVVLGTSLMLVTIIVNHPIEVSEAPMYTSVDMLRKSARADGAAPTKLNLESTRARAGETGSSPLNSVLDQARKSHGIDAEKACDDCD